ncbi:hypothetical protein ACIQBJ_19400 [Kitasatospora sp. NPDC088391]|uniref:hypothetical protein n=1 Tax=Kitasatospora sp. NPDC088391 TaxID=3364074 RepID=UPI0037F63F7A
MPEQELNDVSDVFVRAVGGAAPDLGLLVAGATAEGRSIRRRRRVALSGAVAAVLAAAVTGGVLLRSGAAPAPVTAAAPTVSSPALPATPVPGATTPPPGMVPVDASVLYETLRPLLPAVPPEHRGDAYDFSTNLKGPGSVAAITQAAVWSNGAWASVGVELQYPAPAAPELAVRYDCATYPAVDNCVPVMSGSVPVGVVITGRDQKNRVVHQVDLVNRTGLRIIAQAIGTADTPPGVDRQALTGIATNPIWSPWVTEQEAGKARKEHPVGTHPDPKSINLPVGGLPLPGAGTPTGKTDGGTGGGAH